MSEELIHSYKTRMESPECHPGSTAFNIFISLDDDISEVLPYLNAALSGDLDYRHKDRILLWDGDGKRHAFRAKEIAVATFEENEDAEGYANKLVAKINEIWSRRGNITPSVKGLDPRPKVLDIYKLLPRTNCKKCGFPSCMAYAVQLSMDRSKLVDCEHLSEEDYNKALPPAEG